MSAGASLKGQQAMRRRFATTQRKSPDLIGRGLYVETEVEATEVKKRTPVDKGPLRASEHVVGPKREGEKIYTLIVAGGPSAPYAVYVHENTEAIHPVGQAKYIESTLMESRPHMGARVAARIRSFLIDLLQGM